MTAVTTWLEILRWLLRGWFGWCFQPSVVVKGRGEVAPVSRDRLCTAPVLTVSFMGG